MVPVTARLARVVLDERAMMEEGVEEKTIVAADEWVKVYDEQVAVCCLLAN